MSSYGHLMLNRYDVEVDNPDAIPKTLTAVKNKAATMLCRTHHA